MERHGEHHPMQGCHVDVTITQPDRGPRKGARHLIEEKILRARPIAGPADIVNLETWSCSALGREKRGWFHRDEEALCTVLMICFADIRSYDDDAAEKVTVLDCVWMPFQPLKRWFYDPDLGEEGRFPLHTNQDQINQSVSRLVPIASILGAGVGARRFTIPLVAGLVAYDKDGHLIHFCQCGRDAPFGEVVSVLRGELGRWHCRQHLPKGFLPDPS